MPVKGFSGQGTFDNRNFAGEGTLIAKLGFCIESSSRLIGRHARMVKKIILIIRSIHQDDNINES